MPDKQAACRCEEKQYPLCGFCEDDRFCPQCGGPVAFLQADNEHNEELWIYAAPDEGGAAFDTTLTLVYHDRQRKRCQRRPRLDLDGCSLNARGFFQSQIAVADFPGQKDLARVRLLPLAEHAQRGALWHEELPLEGLPASLLLKGDFPDFRREVVVCRQPRFYIRLKGPNLLEDTPQPSRASPSGEQGLTADGSQHWMVWKEGHFRWELEIEALTAPLWLSAIKLESSADEIQLQLAEVLQSAMHLAPRHPVSLPLEAVVRPWPTGQRRAVEFKLLLVPRGTSAQTLAFEMAELGDIEFSIGDSVLRLGPLFYGEFIRYGEERGATAGLAAGPLKLRHAGGAAGVFLRAPIVEFTDPVQKLKWLSVSWDDGEPGRCKTLNPGEEIVLHLTIHLAGCSPAAIPEDTALRADIVVYDDLQDRQPWRLQVVGKVGRRPELNERLAIDFGTTNLYAAVWNEIGAAANQVEPVLPPRQFAGGPEAGEEASALFFQDVSDPKNPRFVVGDEALDAGRKWPLALVAGLKREIGLPLVNGRWHERDIWDPNDKQARYDTPTLIRFLLRGVVDKCERLQRKTVKHVGFSFPANASARRVRQFAEIVEQFCRERGQEFEAAPLELDEATAVLLSFGLEPKGVKAMRDRLQATSHSEALVAAFDFGGGTINTALMRIRSEGAVGRLHTQYVGLGGDDRFGGDNVTCAAFEMIHDRLPPLLARALGNGGPINLAFADPNSDGSKTARENYHTLWRAAELIKICAGNDDLRRQNAQRLTVQLRRLSVELHESGGRRNRRLHEDAAWQRELATAVEQGDFAIALDALYDHRLRCDRHQAGGYCVRDRITRCVEELFAFTAGHGGELDFVVLAGGSCKLPLVPELIRQRFPAADIQFEPPPAKSKVAAGLARYFNASQWPIAVEGIARSSEFTHAPIGPVVFPGEFAQAVPACSRVRLDEQAAWHELTYHGEPLQWRDVIDSEESRQIRFYQRHYDRNELLGAFDLSQPAAGQRLPSDPAGAAPTLPKEVPSTARLFVRMAGAEDQLQLKVEIDGACCGFWLLNTS